MNEKEYELLSFAAVHMEDSISFMKKHYPDLVANDPSCIEQLILSNAWLIETIALLVAHAENSPVAYVFGAHPSEIH